MKRFVSWFLLFILTTLVLGVNSQMKSTKMIPDCKGKEGKVNTVQMDFRGWGVGGRVVGVVVAENPS